MYTLLSGLYRALTQKEEFSVLILGLDNAGKTTFLESAKTTFTRGYRGVNPSKITATVGLNIGNIEADGVVLNFWDLVQEAGEWVDIQHASVFGADGWA